jgi:hypothetical protein
MAIIPTSPLMERGTGWNLNHRTLRAPANRGHQELEPSRSTLTPPRALGACTNSSPPIDIPTCGRKGKAGVRRKRLKSFDP